MDETPELLEFVVGVLADDLSYVQTFTIDGDPYTTGDEILLPVGTYTVVFPPTLAVGFETYTPVEDRIIRVDHPNQDGYSSLFFEYETPRPPPDEEEEEEEEPTPPGIPPGLEPIDEEPEEPIVIITPPVPFIEVGGLPWYASWLKPIIDYIGVLTESVVNFFEPVFKPIGEIAKGIATIPANIVGAFSEQIGRIIQKSVNKGTDVAVQSVAEAVAESPDWVKDMRSQIDVIQGALVEGYSEALNPETYEKSPLGGEAAVEALQTMKSKLVTMAILNFGLHALVESGSLGQLEFMKDLDSIVVSKFGMNALIERATMLPIEKAVLIPAEQEWFKRHPNLIPAYTDLINMVVKEKITIDEFKGEMLKQGFNPSWSQLIWDAHFIAPSLGDLLTAWRRKLITDERLDELMILVDLDPFYKEIFDTRKYVDPTLRMGRYMYEAGSIDDERLTDIVLRQGYTEEDTLPIVDYLSTFQERGFRTSYLRALATGSVYGAYSEEELRAEVAEAGLSDEVADWMLKTAEVRRRTSIARKKTPAAKLLTLGNIKQGYIEDDISEDDLRTRLAIMGYESGDIDILINQLRRSKVTTVAGGRKLALSQSELLNAWKYKEVEEDFVRTELQMRGLSTLEVEILLATKKKQWGVE